MIDEGVVVTNRHVAELFARRSGKRFPFKLNILSGDPMAARIDFREELPRPGEPAPSQEVAVERVLFIERDEDTLPDVAFLTLARTDEALPVPIPVAEAAAGDGADIAVVGYPARDPRGIPSEAAAQRIFGDIYEVKRLSPGKVLIADAADWYFTHDATTLGGNSGSAVLELATGAAVGLHFMGELAAANYAVSAGALRDYLGKLKLRSHVPVSSRLTAPEREPVLEGTVADYADREGYDPEFLGEDNDVPLPKKVKRPRDLLTFPVGSRRSSELRYTHFSVAMSRKRKLCVYSAVNIDGTDSRAATRRNWRFDPRIPRDAQTEGEVYGNEPQFSRGHMTRREDPIWGPADVALLGNWDSMHVTNAVPQMQPFNAGIWLGLEDYALEHAREDDMRISVLTGPVLHDDDPVKFGVQIPLEFWKLIAFVHDETGELTATGYLMSQASFLEPEEFVFGRHETYQVPITTIEAKAGLSFGALSDRDPLRGQEEAPVVQLTAMDQIRL
jgi:endonuclease G